MAKVYTGAGRLFQEVQSVGMDEESVQDIERRIKLQPHFLGEPLVVIGESKDFPQVVPAQSHDLVALDAVGRSIAISLTSGVADVGSDMHALQLCAHLASLSADELGKIARSFIGRPVNDALRRAWEENDVEIEDESVELASLLAATFHRDAENYANTLNAEQRVMIAAEGFASRLVNLIQWLVRRGVNIVGLRYRKFMVGGQEVYFAEQVVPTLDPSVDAPERSKPVAAESLDPWRIRGRLYHMEHLNPLIGARLDEILVMMRPATFAVNWSNRHYFWVRGAKRNLRIRTYYRDRLEIGFYNASAAMIQEALSASGLPSLEISTVGGYADSPFITVTAETRMDDRWGKLLCGWLNGEALEGRER
jgi:hypothetical protein